MVGTAGGEPAPEPGAERQPARPRTGTLFPDLSALDPGLSDIGERLPHHDRQVQLTLTRRDAWGQSGIELARRNALGEFTALQLSRELQLDRQLSVNVIGINQPAGMANDYSRSGSKDGVQRPAADADPAGLCRRAMAPRNAAQPVAPRTGQGRCSTGKSATVCVPNIPTGPFVSGGYHNRFHPLPTTLAEIARSCRSLPCRTISSACCCRKTAAASASISVSGSNSPATTAAPPRLFGDVGISHSPSTGVGYNWLLGIAGSALGNDHLSLWAGRSWGGTRMPSTPVRLVLNTNCFIGRSHVQTATGLGAALLLAACSTIRTGPPVAPLDKSAQWALLPDRQPDPKRRRPGCASAGRIGIAAAAS